ncbi:hypothetical protein, partial [Pantoea sp. Morm]|uniref:hypothetical protein n=1 Tax=Pantoea sp. Morm TaxID=2601250 RepID=UPI0031FC0F26
IGVKGNLLLTGCPKAKPHAAVSKDFSTPGFFQRCGFHSIASLSPARGMDDIKRFAFLKTIYSLNTKD